MPSPWAYTPPEVDLSEGVSLLGGAAIPLRRLGSILRNALAVAIHDPEAKLSLGVSLFGKVPKTKQGRCVIAAGRSGRFEHLGCRRTG